MKNHDINVEAIIGEKVIEVGPISTTGSAMCVDTYLRAVCFSRIKSEIGVDKIINSLNGTFEATISMPYFEKEYNSVTSEFCFLLFSDILAVRDDIEGVRAFPESDCKSITDNVEATFEKIGEFFNQKISQSVEQIREETGNVKVLSIGGTYDLSDDHYIYIQVSYNKDTDSADIHVKSTILANGANTQPVEE